MKICAILAAGLCLATLCAATLKAQHAKIAAARPVSASVAAKPVATHESRPAVATKPVPVHVPATLPARRPTDLRAGVGHVRLVERRWTPYWQNFCFANPFAAVCREHELAVRQTSAAPDAPSVILNPFATTPALGPASVLAYQTVSSAPAPPIVKVSDELAATVSVGAVQADILKTLGEPHSRISGDVERYTYFLQSGGSLKLDFEDGHVTQVRNANN